jgi:hypothetical protein
LAGLLEDLPMGLRARIRRLRMDRAACFDRTGKYRYFLSRRWASKGKHVCFVLLNPSTADAFQDDPTIRRCVGFAKELGGAALAVVNLFALRATDPKELLRAVDPIGPHNTHWLVETIRKSDIAVVGWGAHLLAGPYARTVIEENCLAGLACLGVNADGSPKHPLYVKGGTGLLPWSPR